MEAKTNEPAVKDEKSKYASYSVRLKTEHWRSLCFVSKQYGTNPEVIVDRLIKAFLKEKEIRQ